MDKVIQIDNKYKYLKDYLIKVTVNNTLLLLGIEQGLGQYAKDVFIIYNPKMKKEVQKWFSKKYKNIKEQGITSIEPIENNEDNKYNTYIQKFISSVISTQSVLKLNNFGKKYKSYVKALV